MGGKGYDATGAANRAYKKSVTFFKDMRKDVEHINKRESLEMAQEMHNILKLRKDLKGQGSVFGMARYPKFAGKSKFSHREWSLEPRANGEYWLYNDAVHNYYNYPKALISGKGWRDDVKAGGKLVRGSNGGLFSTQMPKGLDPWIKVKREELEYNIKKAIKDEL